MSSGSPASITRLRFRRRQRADSGASPSKSRLPWLRAERFQRYVRGPHVRLLHPAAEDVLRDLKAERDAADVPGDVDVAVGADLERVEGPVDAEEDAAEAVFDDHLPQAVLEVPAVPRAYRAPMVLGFAVQLVRDEVEPFEQVAAFRLPIFTP